jgi:UDP-N-acetylmuramyl pentapeptide phosphotransferase/UDP-N-acetylglucosamine-1-phosphate transferase
LTAIIRRAALKVGFTDRPGHRKIHHVPKPLGGGIAILLAMVIPMVGGFIVVKTATFSGGGEGLLGRVENLVAVHQAGIVHQAPLAMKVLLAMVAMHIAGAGG